VRRSCRASPSWRRCLGPSDPVIYNVTPSSSSPSCGPHVSSRSLRCSDHRQVRERLFSSRFRRTRHYSAANCFIKVRGADHHARRPKRSSRSWHRTQHCTSGMACSRAGEIDSPHSPQVPVLTLVELRAPPRGQQQLARDETDVPALTGLDRVTLSRRLLRAPNLVALHRARQLDLRPLARADTWIREADEYNRLNPPAY
jgi:hypothetical protein